MDVTNMDSCSCKSDCCETLAIATVPMQRWEEPYDPSAGLKAGTIFPALDKPFFLGGGTLGR